MAKKKTRVSKKSSSSTLPSSKFKFIDGYSENEGFCLPQVFKSALDIRTVIKWEDNTYVVHTIYGKNYNFKKNDHIHSIKEAYTKPWGFISEKKKLTIRILSVIPAHRFYKDNEDVDIDANEIEPDLMAVVKTPKKRKKLYSPGYVKFKVIEYSSQLPSKVIQKHTYECTQVEFVEYLYSGINTAKMMEI